MNAGAINISVSATMDQFNRKMSEVKTTAASTAKDAGGKFGVNFGREFENQGAAILKRVAGPMMAAQLADGFANFLRSDKSMAEAAQDALKSIPFVGSFVNLGNAIYDATFGAADKAAEDFVKKQDAARDSIRQGASMREGQLREEQSLQATLLLENRRLEIQRETMKVRMTGSEGGIAFAEYEARMSELQLKRGQELAKTEDEQTRRMIEDRYELELGLARMTRDKRLADIAEVREKEALAAKAAAEKEADAIAIANSREAERQSALREREEKERLATIRRVADEEARMMQERDEAQRAGLGSQQTALGSFRFDAYPETEKKQNDIRIVRALEAIRAQGAAGGFT
jgi:hypothetical protein